MVIRGGQFRQRPGYLSAQNNETLANCRKVFICGGTFEDGALHGSEHVIISRGTFQALGNVEGLTIINGTFSFITAQQNTLIIGGNINCLSPGIGTIVVGGTIESIMWPTYATALIWLPTLALMQTGVPFNSRILAATLEVGRFSRERWEDDLRNSKGAIYVASCPPIAPPAGYALPEILDLTFIAPRQYLYEQRPFLRKDGNINRTNIKAWLGAQFERLRQISNPWAQQKNG